MNALSVRPEGNIEHAVDGDATLVSIPRAEFSARLRRTIADELPFLAADAAKRLVKRIERDVCSHSEPDPIIEVVDEVSGLTVPPASRARYVDSSLTTGPVAFLKVTWGDYLSAGLLTIGHLVKVDRSLYDALMREAGDLSKPFRSFVADLGLITPEILRLPPPHLKRQALLLKRIYHRKPGRLSRRT